jgi:hypothetical protein
MPGEPLLAGTDPLLLLLQPAPLLTRKLQHSSPTFTSPQYQPFFEFILAMLERLVFFYCGWWNRFAIAPPRIEKSLQNVARIFA